MRQSLTVAGYVEEGTTADQVLADFAGVPAHYRRLLSSVGAAGERFAALRAEVAELTPRAALAEERYQQSGTLEREAAELRTARDDTDRAVHLLTNGVSTLEGERAVLTARLATTTSHLNAANGRVGGLEQVRDQYAANATAATAQARERETQRDAALTRCTILETERDEARTRNGVLEGERDESRNERDAGVANAQALQVELTQARAALVNAPLSAWDRNAIVEVNAYVGRSVATLVRVAQEAGDAVTRIQQATESNALGNLFGDANLGADIRSRIAALDGVLHTTEDPPPCPGANPPSRGAN